MNWTTDEKHPHVICCGDRTVAFCIDPMEAIDLCDAMNQLDDLNYELQKAYEDKMRLEDELDELRERLRGGDCANDNGASFPF